MYKFLVIIIFIFCVSGCDKNKSVMAHSTCVTIDSYKTGNKGYCGKACYYDKRNELRRCYNAFTGKITEHWEER